MEQTVAQLNTKEALDWAKFLYYGGGALVAFIVAYTRLKRIIQRRRKKNTGG